MQVRFLGLRNSPRICDGMGGLVATVRVLSDRGDHWRIMNHDSIIYWLGLARIEGLGIRSAHRLLEHFGSAPAAYNASLTELESCGISPRAAQAVFAQEGLKEAEGELKAAEKAACTLVVYDGEDYPPRLREIPDAPLLLYVRGDAKLLSECCLAMVGTRKPSAYGSQVAHRLARDLADRGVLIVSGLARGIDSCAHRGALEAKDGKTIAVQGRGMDDIYPRENRKLAEKISERGAVISEFPLGTGPTPENFPIRNRIISGLSLGVLVTEAAEYSGSLITARLAVDQNREVFAVPGNITSAQSFGPNYLIKQGAKLVDQWLDVIEEFPSEVRMQLMPPQAASESIRPGEAPSLFEQSLTPDQKAIFEFLRVDEASFIDSVLTGVPLPPPRIMQTLLELEMAGLVRQLPGKNFIRKL